MKKKFTAFLICLCMSLSIAVPSMAADGINAHEQALLNGFISNIYALAAEHDSIANVAAQYISVATNVLMQVDLDAQACADLTAAMNAAVAMVNEGEWESAMSIASSSTSVLTTVNETTQEYGMTVGVDVGGNDYATVTFMTDQGEQTVGGSTKPPVNQTGTDVSAAASAASALLVLFLSGLFLAFRKKLFSRQGTEQ